MLDLRQRMYFRRRVIPLFVILACCPRCLSGAAVSAPRTIVLITLDTTRADRMGFLGSPSGLTPNLDALARESIVFTHAYAQVPITSASHATILTGTYPQFHQVNDAGMPLRKEVPYAPEIFRRNRYQTAAFVGCVILDPKAGGAPGFDRGFDTYDAGFHTRRPGQDRYHAMERRGAEVVAQAIAWLAKHSGAPFFLWVHLYDPHAPYDPPEPFKSRYAAHPYDGEVAYADSVAGKLLDQLRAKKLYAGALLAVLADHGEAFGEHGERGHGTFLYDPTLHVPLLIKLPGERFAGKRIDARVELADLLPTILQAAGLAVPAAVQGKSLLPMLNPPGKGESASERSAYAETDYPQRAYGWSSLRALRTGKYLLIQSPRRELYDESSDPAAEHNLSATQAAVAETLTAQLEKFRNQTRAPGTAPQAGLDPDREAQVRALGYVVSSQRQTNPGTEPSGPDPKDKIETANQMTEASLALEDSRYQEAIALLQQVVARDSSVSVAYATLGTAWISLGDYQQAVPVLRKAVELRPDSVTAHYQLGMALFQIGDFKSAAPQFEAAVAGSPRSADMHFSLASIYVRLERRADAKKELGKALQLKPAHYGANLMLGRILVVQKNAAAALPYLQKAARMQPEVPEPHALLAEAYEQLGQKDRASQQRALAKRARKPRGQE